MFDVVRQQKDWRNFLPEPLCRKAVYFYRYGREALLQALIAGRCKQDDTILLPDYFCSEISAFLERHGFHIVYYKVNNDLRADEDHVVRCIDDSCKALVAVHFFGIRQDMTGLRKICRHNNMVFIEDNAHCLPYHFQNSDITLLGDFAVYSLRKVLSVSSGAALVVNNDRFKPTNIMQPPLPRITFIQNSVWGIKNYLLEHVPQTIPLFAAAKTLFPPQILDSSQHNDILEDGCSNNIYFSRTGIDPKSWHRILTTDYIRVAAERRENYRHLAAWLVNRQDCHVLYPDLDKNACPQALPVLVHDAPAVIASLRSAGIGARPWPHLPACVKNNPVRHVHANYLANNLIMLPLGSFYTIREQGCCTMERDSLVDRISRAYGIR